MDQISETNEQVIADLTAKFICLDRFIIKIIKLRHELMDIERHVFENPSLVLVDKYFEYYDYLDWVPLENCVCGYDSTRATIPPLKRTLSNNSLSDPETQ